MSTADELVIRLRSSGCVFAEEEAAVLLGAGFPPDELEAAVVRRVAGEPLEVILGWVLFHGLRVRVSAGVFVPRRRTERLVDEAIHLSSGDPVVVDLCCGSGAIGAAVAAALPGATVYAADIDPMAVAVARRNLPADRVFQGDLFDALPVALRGRVDLLLVNAPYVPSDAVRLMPPEAREHEPLVTLDGGPDGLDVQRRVARDAAGWLARGGAVLIETSTAQARATAALLSAGGLRTRVVRDEEAGATIAVGVRD